jgi:hypothetical protein
MRICTFLHILESLLRARQQALSRTPQLLAICGIHLEFAHSLRELGSMLRDRVE